MWTYTIDQTAGGLCRTYNSVLGHFPTACLTDAGRPALWLTLAIAVAVVFAANVAWNKRQARRA